MNAEVLGSVPYLNATPLVDMLETTRPELTVRKAVPSELARMLARREVAAALVSSVVPLSDMSLCALRVGAVTSDGPVRSIRLLSRVPIHRIERLALDASSRTGVILCQVLLARVYGLRPTVVSLPPSLPDMLEQADAALLIGDPALRASVDMERGALPLVHEDLDLGSLWRSETGLPFVYAMWAVPRDGDVRGLSSLLRASAEWGLARRDEIADREARRLDLPAPLCRRYLTENIRYSFGPREWEGLRRFHSLAVEMNFLPPRANPLECLEAPDAEPALP